MSTRYGSISVRKAITDFLCDFPASEMPQIYNDVRPILDVDSEVVRRAVSKMREEGLLTADTEHLRHYKYSLAEEQPRQRHLPPSRFKVPLAMRGPVLSPMAWSLRHLLGAAG